VGLENIESWTGRLLVGSIGGNSEGLSSLFQKGDVLFGKLRPYLAKVLLAQAPGRCSSELLVLRARDLLPAFLRYVLLSEPLIRLVDSSTYGAKMPRPEWDFIIRLVVPIPAASVQRRITEFLDRKTAAIDSLITKKERLIELLGERRQALITRAVTIGLDSDVPTRESSLSNLGRVASHWKTQPLRHRLNRIEQGWSPACENRPAEDHEWGVLKVGCVNGGFFDETENKALPPELNPMPEIEVQPGDVLVSRANTRELAGSVALVRKMRSRLLLCDKLFRLGYRRESTDPSYLALALQSRHARWQIERDATGASDSMQNIGQDTIRGLVLAWPPIEEQRRIAAEIDLEDKKFADISMRVHREIEALKEYRQALITAAVTGQVEISQAQEAA
jgi:type I restriction enzyme, S subunit